MINLKKRWLLFAVLLFILGACDTYQQAPKDTFEASESNVIFEQVPNDLHEMTRNKDVLPDFLNTYEADMKTIYRDVSQHQQLLAHIPCYCGCDEMAHDSSLNCFITSVNESDTIIWTDHATKCPVCLEIASESLSAYKEGQKSIDEIRTMIEDKYEKVDFSKSTETSYFKK